MDGKITVPGNLAVEGIEETKKIPPVHRKCVGTCADLQGTGERGGVEYRITQEFENFMDGVQDYRGARRLLPRLLAAPLNFQVL